MAISVLFRVDGDGNIEGVDDGPVPPVVVAPTGSSKPSTGSSPTTVRTPTGSYGAGCHRTFTEPRVPVGWAIP